MKFEGANQALQKIVEDDNQLAELVQQIGLVPLLLSVVHITGALDIIRGVPVQPARMPGDFSGGLAPDVAQPLRERALAEIRRWRDAGCPEPYTPTRAELQEMVDFLHGLKMPPKYLDPVLEDMGYGGDTRHVDWQYKAATADAADVLIIGAGMAGLAMGYRLKCAGVPFRIVEKNAGVGGTWHENRYPGCRVDVPSQAYSFNSTQDYEWPHIYSRQPELRAYFENCAVRFGLTEAIELNTRVVAAKFDEAASRWVVTVERASGAREVLRPKFLISAVGLLNIPSEPHFEGRDEFRGAIFHTARWPSDVTIEGKRVAVIGNGATAIQAIPEIARVAGSLTVFQRTANWCAISANYESEIDAAQRWAIRHLPYFSGWVRVKMFNWNIDLSNAHVKVDPDWPQDGLSVSAANNMIRQFVSMQVRDRLKEHPDIAERLIPDHPFYSKRPCVGSGAFFDAFKQPNVQLVTDGVARFDATGIVDGAGRRHDVDVVVLATGFQVQNYLGSFDLIGRGGTSLKAYWGEDACAYLGMTVPRFPNFFIMYGPGTNFGFNGNLVWLAEIQARYILLSMKMMLESGRDTIEVSEEKYTDYWQRSQEELSTFVSSVTHAGNYFRNSSGRVTSNMPWFLVDYWNWLREPNPGDFVETARRQPAHAT